MHPFRVHAFYCTVVYRLPVKTPARCRLEVTRYIDAAPGLIYCGRIDHLGSRVDRESGVRETEPRVYLNRDIAYVLLQRHFHHMGRWTQAAATVAYSTRTPAVSGFYSGSYMPEVSTTTARVIFKLSAGIVTLSAERLLVQRCTSLSVRTDNRGLRNRRISVTCIA